MFSVPTLSGNLAHTDALFVYRPDATASIFDAFVKHDAFLKA